MGKPENIDKALRHSKEARIGGEKGWTGRYALVNRHPGKILTITLRETKEAMEAIVSMANQIRGKVADLAGAAPPTVEVYEVALQP